MGREIKRVPVDFDWPLDKIWHGYVNPHCEDCPDCEAGYSNTYRLVAKHINSFVWDTDALKQSEEYCTITTFLCEREPHRFLLGHDSLDAMHAIKKLGELAGLPNGWGTCQTCGGDGIHPDYKEVYEAWESEEPPEGDGWQVWETVSEGSPISPVFSDSYLLIDWLKEQGYSRDAARAFVERQWAPSMVMAISSDGVQIKDDIESLTLLEGSGEQGIAAND